MFVAQGIYAGTFTDGFETGDFSHSEDGVRWTDHCAVVSGEKPMDGKYSAKFLFPGDPNSTTDIGCVLYFSLNRYYNDFWIKFDVFFPRNWAPRDRDAQAHNKGPVMLASDNGWHDSLKAYSSYEAWNGTEHPTGCVSYNRGGFRGHRYPQLNGKYFLYPDPAKDLGRWMNIVARIKFATSSDSNDGIFQIWKDGELGLSVTDANNYLLNGKPGGNFGYIFGPADTGFNVDTIIYIDNLVISDKPLVGDKQISPPMPPVLQ